MPSNIPKSHEKSRRKKGESAAPTKNYGTSPKRMRARACVSQPCKSCELACYDRQDCWICWIMKSSVLQTKVSKSHDWMLSRKTGHHTLSKIIKIISLEFSLEIPTIPTFQVFFFLILAPKIILCSIRSNFVLLKFWQTDKFIFEKFRWIIARFVQTFLTRPRRTSRAWFRSIETNARDAPWVTYYGVSPKTG